MITLTREKIVLLDVVLLFIAFFAVNYLKRGSFALPGGYFDLLVVFYACWFLAALVGKKFQVGEYRNLQSGLRTLFKSDCYLVYSISFVIVFFGLGQYSRIQVFSSCLLLFALNVVVWLAGHRMVMGGGERLEAPPQEKTTGSETASIHYRLLTADLVLLLTSFWVVNWLKRGHWGLAPEYDKLLMVILTLWFLISLITRKFRVAAFRNAYDVFWQWEKAGLMMLAGVAAVVFAFRLFHYSRIQGFGTILMLMGLEAILLMLVFGGRKERRAPADVESAEQVQQVLGQAPVDTNVDIEAIREMMMAPANRQLEGRLTAAESGVYPFLEANLPLDEILWLETAIAQSCEPIGRQFSGMPVRLFVNLYKLNDVRRMNQYFLEVYQTLLAGGYFVGYAHTIRTHHQWVYQKFPRLMAHFVYSADFLVNRVAPKLPGIKRFYFMVTRGKNRIVSRAEVMGRLSFCGFEIVASQDFNRRFWVIARKVKRPSFNMNPTYGPLVTLNRVGHQGEIIKVYKLRTMHPYSEYLQDFVFAEQGLQEGGKLKDDFRVTSWGRVFRKLWIDELPMLYNWVKGELKIVGVRPLSSHYLSLYDEELQQLRLQIKPGLIPPFYVDLPETLDEICESEKTYLRAYLKNPVKTDLYYGFVALWNIFVKKARSG